MHPKFKLTLAALAVSVVLTGCKSSQGPSVVAKNSDDRVIKLNAETEDKKEETPAEQPRPAPQKPQVTPPAPLLPTTPKLEEKPNKEMVETTPKPEEKPNEKMVEEGNNGEDEIKVITSITPVNTDSKGSTWRVVPLSQTGGVVNLSTARGDHTDYRLTDENSLSAQAKSLGRQNITTQLVLSWEKMSKTAHSLKHSTNGVISISVSIPALIKTINWSATAKKSIISTSISHIPVMVHSLPMQTTAICSTFS